MLTDLITHRFAKHHGYLLASMDALEEVSRDLLQPHDAESPLHDHEALLHQIFDFLIEDESQHEMEEERILLPVLEGQIDRSVEPQSAQTVERISLEHSRGQELIRRAKASFDDLIADRRQEVDAYRQFSELLLELVRHYRIHVRNEDSIVFPATRRLVPDSADEIWAEEEPTRHERPA